MTDSYAISWSGGKDGCMALYEARRGGLHVSHLVNFVNTEPDRVRLHGKDPELVRLQSKALGIPLVQVETTWKGYEQDFKSTLLQLKPSGLKGMVFGDIYLQEHLDWVNRVCGEIGLEALEPLWGKDTEELFFSFVEAGFEASIVSAKSDLIGREWTGQNLGKPFAEYMRQKGIDFCGEKGEYHTLVKYGPPFRRRLVFQETAIEERDSYWLLDIRKYGLEQV
ncbi:MAG: diphthine--ammonia ligase [Dehalococcoidia bacterium]|jgi:uncharacterized protein (TIGR00290 family)